MKSERGCRRARCSAAVVRSVRRYPSHGTPNLHIPTLYSSWTPPAHNCPPAGGCHRASGVTSLSVSLARRQQRDIHRTIMRKRGVDLPMASGGRSPTPPRRQLNMPDATPANVFSFTWVLCGFALICMGYGHCSRHSEQSRLYCAEDVCRFSRDSTENQR